MILFRYIAKEVFVTTFTVAAVVLVISMGWRFSGYLKQAATGSMVPEALFVLMAYRLPGFLELIVPVSFFLAIMLVYGRLYVDNEMVVLQACGVSDARIVRITLTLSVFVMLLTATIALWLKPMGEQRVESLLAGQKNLTEFDTLIAGRFQQSSSGRRVTYAEETDNEGKLTGVFVNEYRGPTSVGNAGDTLTIVAKSGRTEVDGSGRRLLVLNDGTRYRGTPGQRGYQVIHYEEYGLTIKKEDPSISKARRTAIATTDLLSATSPEAVSELHWRISVVLLVPVMALMALPLARVNPRQGRYSRLLPAMILCFIYLVSLSAARSGMERQTLPLGPGLWWVHGIYVFIVVCLYHPGRFLYLIDRFRHG